MEDFDRKKHWENIYQTKELKEVSWYQPIPSTSIEFIELDSIPFGAKIIDIGGGDSFLVDHLLKLGFMDISVLDISASSLERAKQRLGDRSSNVKWIEADASNFAPTEKYDVWHDRAAFHFLTKETEITNYLETASQNINPEGVLIIGSFSEQGPSKCSGIQIKQYSAESMTELVNPWFEFISSKTLDHQTPSGSIQNFIFCSFRKRR